MENDALRDRIGCVDAHSGDVAAGLRSEQLARHLDRRRPRHRHDPHRRTWVVRWDSSSPSPRIVVEDETTKFVVAASALTSP